MDVNEKMTQAVADALKAMQEQIEATATLMNVDRSGDQWTRVALAQTRTIAAIARLTA